MTVRLRIAQPHDEMAIGELLMRSYQVLLAPAYPPETLMQVLPLVTKARPDLLTSGTYYVAETPAGQIAGAGGWTKHSPTGRDETANNGNIRHFATHPEHARQGIGSALISRCLQTAAASGLTELNCYSTLNGEAFYAACGFKRMEPVTIPLPGDVPFPAIRMVKGL